MAYKKVLAALGKPLARYLGFSNTNGQTNNHYDVRFEDGSAKVYLDRLDEIVKREPLDWSFLAITPHGKERMRKIHQHSEALSKEFFSALVQAYEKYAVQESKSLSWYTKAWNSARFRRVSLEDMPVVLNIDFYYGDSSYTPEAVDEMFVEKFEYNARLADRSSEAREGLREVLIYVPELFVGAATLTVIGGLATGNPTLLKATAAADAVAIMLTAVSYPLRRKEEEAKMLRRSIEELSDTTRRYHKI